MVEVCGGFLGGCDRARGLIMYWKGEDARTPRVKWEFPVRKVRAVEKLTATSLVAKCRRREAASRLVIGVESRALRLSAIGTARDAPLYFPGTESRRARD